jgi:hypothetical protein
MIVLVAAVMMTLGLSVQLGTISGIEETTLANQSEQAYIAAEGCVEDALLRLREDPNAAEGLLTITLGATQCTTTITRAGKLRTIVGRGTFGQTTRMVRVVVSVEAIPGPVTIISWQEGT